MPRFLGADDIQLFKNISQQMVHEIIDTNILFYKLNIQQTQTNVYGQSNRKIYHQPLRIPCLIQHSPQNLDFADSIEYRNNSQFRFLKSTLIKANLKPMIGDVIKWRRTYWQITLVRNQQLLGGRVDLEWSCVCQTTIVSQSKLKQISQPKSNMKRVVRRTVVEV